MGTIYLRISQQIHYKLLFLTVCVLLCLSSYASDLPLSLSKLVAHENIEQLALTSAELQWIKAHPKLRAAVKTGWIPIEFKLENQKHKGVSVDYLKRISQLTGLEFTVIDYHDNISPNDAELITGIRGQIPPIGFKLLEIPYLETANAIYVASKTSFYQSEIKLNQLSNKTLAVYKSGPLAQKLKALLPHARIKLVDLADEAFDDLNSGAVDAYIGNELVLDYHKYFHKIKVIKKAGKTPITSKVFMGVKDTDVLLNSILNKATLHIGTNPEEVLETYQRTSTDTFNKLLIGTISFFALILLIQLIKLYKSSKLQEKNASETIWFQANHDFLTKLPNRYLIKNKLNEALQRTAESQHTIGVMILDLDNFKDVNDTSGHAIGDEVLIEAAERIKSVITPPHIVSRFGGDEFLILILSNPDEMWLNALCASLVHQMKEPFRVQQKSFVISMSIGASLSPNHSTNADELIMFADEAMYQAKRTGKNKFVLFDENLHTLLTERTHLANELRYAIQRDQLFLHYQPIFNLKTMQCEKIEALLRWKHPELGFISPEIFIKLAEGNGCITDLGNWLFQQTLLDYPLLSRRYGNIQICMNISPIQFTQAEPIHQFISNLKTLGISGNNFCFEITEGLLLEPSNQTLQNLREINTHGIKLAIDDFGTGYSSLAYLNKFRIDYVKIDKSFISNITQNLNDQVLCRSIIYMGKQLSMKLIAEGVETIEQEMLLKEMECNYSQGYLRAKPMAIEDL